MDGPGSWCLIFAAICVLLTTFFSSANLALRHISWTKLEEALAQKNRAERVSFMRQRHFDFVCSTAVFRVLSNLLLLLILVYYFSAVWAEHPKSSFLSLLSAFAISGLVLMVFSVGIPHAWAKYSGTYLLVWFYPLLVLLVRIMWPIVKFLTIFDPMVRRLAGVTPHDANERLEEKQEELLIAVEVGEKEGVVNEEEKEMIQSVLEFRETTAGEIMTPRTEVVGIEVNTKLPAIIETVINNGHSRYPVYEESIDHIVGMLYAKDLLCDLNQPDGSKSIKQRLRKPFFVPESKNLRDLLHDFQNQKVHLAVVLDEYGGTAGVVTIEDILEEIVGEITDEYEPPQAEPLQRIDERTIEVDARYDVDELNDQCNLHIPEDEAYETIGGFAFSKLGSIPHTGQTFDHENLHFTIIDAGQRKINRLRIEIAEQPDHNVD